MPSPQGFRVKAHPVAAGLAGAALTGLVLLLYVSGILDTLELKSYDLRFKCRGPVEPRGDIVLVTIDPATVSDLGKKTSEITRREHALVLAELTARGAELVVYDMDFSSPSTDPEEDYYFQEVIAENPGKVVMSSYVAQGKWVRPVEQFRKGLVGAGQWEFHGTPDEQGSLTVKWPGNEQAEGYAVFASTEYITDPYAPGVRELDPVPGGKTSIQLEGLEPGVEHRFLVIGHVQRPLLAAEGAINLIEDKDDRIRSMPLVVSTPAGEPVQSLSLATVMAKKWPQGEWQDCSGKEDELCLAGGGEILRIPTVDGNMLINFPGMKGAFPRVSFSKLTPNHLDEDDFPDLSGKIAMIGNTHPAVHDEYPTPFTRAGAEGGADFGYTPGLEIHAAALHTILSRQFIKKQSETSAVIAALALGLGLTLLWLLFRAFSMPGIVVLLVATGGLAVLSQHLFQTHNYWMATTPLLLVSGLAFVGVMTVQTLGEYREKRFIKSAFSMYLAPAVIEEIIKNPERLNLGGEQRVMTVLFSDVAGFSSISEKLNPHELVTLVNRYLTPMCDAILDHEGTVDKFEGDAVIAFFGAPILHPDHARRACLAALDMQKKNEELNRHLADEGKDPLKTRIGVNTGPMVVGNMGSDQRMDYTVMGDSVNLAARLESANKQYGTLLMISEETYKQARDAVEARELDVIRVVGKEEPVRVYELLAQKGSLSAQDRAALQDFESGLALYRSAKWDEAIAMFEKADRERGEDPPSRLFIERCKEYKDNPPGPEWDGAYTLTEK